MNTLANMTCIPCRKGDPPLDKERMEGYLELLSDWEVVNREGNPRLERAFVFPDYQGALEFTNRVGDMAGEVDHHPAILLT